MPMFTAQSVLSCAIIYSNMFCNVCSVCTLLLLICFLVLFVVNLQKLKLFPFH